MTTESQPLTAVRVKRRAIPFGSDHWQAVDSATDTVDWHVSRVPYAEAFAAIRFSTRGQIVL